MLTQSLSSEVPLPPNPRISSSNEFSLREADFFGGSIGLRACIFFTIVGPFLALVDLVMRRCTA